MTIDSILELVLAVIAGIGVAIGAVITLYRQTIKPMLEGIKREQDSNSRATHREEIVRKLERLALLSQNDPKYPELLNEVQALVRYYTSRQDLEGKPWNHFDEIRTLYKGVVGSDIR